MCTTTFSSAKTLTAMKHWNHELNEFHLSDQISLTVGYQLAVPYRVNIELVHEDNKLTAVVR